MATTGTVRGLRVVHVSFHRDTQRRAAESLLGAWPTLSAVAASVRRADVDVAVVQAAHAAETLRRDDVDYHFVHDERRIPARLIERVRSLAPEVVHVHGFHHPLAVRQLARVCRPISVLIQDHGSVPPAGWRATAWRWAFRSTAGAAFTAHEQARPWIQSRVLRADLPTFEALESSSTFTPGNVDEARAVTGMFGDPCLLWTGRLNANKDPLTMLEAVERAASVLPHARLWCCFGAAPLLDHVRRRIADSRILSERVALIGERPHAELEARYRAADFYIQTSRREGSGYSLIEALACGATPIVADIPPARRIVGNAGSLTPVGDARAMAEAIVAWSSRDRVALRRTARARFDAALTFDAIGRDLRSAYESLARSR